MPENKGVAPLAAFGLALLGFLVPVGVRPVV